MGMFSDALQAVETYSRLGVDKTDSKLHMAWVHAYSGNVDEAKRMLTEVGSEFRGSQASPFDMACVWFKLGDADAGFEWLQRAYDDHDRFIFLMAISYELDGVRSDQRYLSFLRKLGLPEEVRT